MDSEFKRLQRSVIGIVGTGWAATIACVMAVLLVAEQKVSFWDKAAVIARADEAQHAGWLESRRHELAATEAGSTALAQARSALAGTKPTMPIEAAICLKARQDIDLTLRQAMRPGREFGAELTQWHAQNRAVEIYCAYALTIGAKR